MFGMKMWVDYQDLDILLRPFQKEDLETVADGFSSMRVHMYTMGNFAATVENEQEWYDSMRKSKEEVAWAIALKQQPSVPIGVTALHKVDLFGSCTSGTIIWDQTMWGKGITTRSHLARTLFAADFLNRYTIVSGARVPNQGSFKALQRVGYHLYGIEPRTCFRQGRFLDSYRLVWMHPERTDLMFPDGVPNEYKEALKKAQTALNTARKVVSFDPS